MPDFFNDSTAGYSDQFFGMPPMDDEQRKRLLRTPPFLPAQPAQVDSQDFADTAKARQASDASPAGAQTADPNEVRLPERAARTATPPTGSAMDSPAFNALVTPRKATPEDRYNEWESRQPRQADFTGKPSLARRVFGGLVGGMVGLGNPEMGMQVGRDITTRGADRRFAQARQAWEDEGKAITAGAQLADISAQTEERQRNAAKPQTVESGGQAYERQPDGSWKPIGNPKPGGEEDWTTVPGVTGPNGEPVQQEKHSGQMRIAPLAGATVVDRTAKEKPTEVQEDQRFEQIDSARRMGKPVSPEDKAWADAYKNRKTLGQQVINVGADVRGKSFGRNRPMQVLDTWNGNRPVVVSAGEAEDNPQRYVTQSGGEKSLPKEALINDIRVSAENVKKNLAVLDSSGFDRVKLAAALADPNSTAQSYLQAIPRGSLDENSQQFVADLFNLREQAMAMRSVLGAGQGSEDMRRAILSTLPGVASPSQKFGAKQIDNLIAVLNRVERGVPQVPLAPERGGGQGRGGGAAKTYTDAEIQAAAKAHNMTPAQIEKAYKSKGYTKAVQ